MNNNRFSKNKYDGVLLYSGGLDSYVAYYYVSKVRKANVIPVYFCLGNTYEWFEEDHILNMKEFNVLVDSCLKVGDIEDLNNFHIPMRNVLLMILAATRFHENVFIGSLFDDNSPDGDEKTFKLVTKLLNHVENQEYKDKVFNVYAPFREDGLRKAQVCRWYTQNIGTAENLTRNTVSCFNPQKRKETVGLKDGDYESPHCYSCPACFRRNASLFDVGVNLPFYRKDLILSYKEKFESKTYDIVRSQVSLKYINWLKENGYF